MTRITTIVVLALACVAVDCSAAPPEGKRGKGAREGGGNAQQRGGDPSQIVSRMMQEFDKDGDQKLDAQELTLLMISMRERRMSGAAGARNGGLGDAGPKSGGRRPGQAAGQAAGKEAGKGRQRAGANGQGKRGDAINNRPGGEKPKRPLAE